MNIETSTLGVALLDPAIRAPLFAAIHDPSSFDSPAHGEVFRVMRQMHEERIPIDATTVVDRLQGDAKALEATGGWHTVAELMEAGSTAVGGNYDHWITTLQEKASERKRGKLRDQVRAIAEDPDLDGAAFASTAKGLLEELERVAPPRVETLALRWREGALDAALDSTRPLLRLEDAGLGSWLDRTLGGGVQPGNMIGLVSAGAGTGKTAFAHQMADGFAKHSAAALEGAAGSGHRPVVVPVLFVTEMQVRDLTIRSLSREAGVRGSLLRAPNSRAGRMVTPKDQASVIAALDTYRQTDPPQKATDGELALWAARETAARMKPAAEFLTPLDRTARIGTGVAAVRKIHQQAERIRASWEAVADVAAVVIMVDPLHRLLDPSLEETAGLGDALGELLSISHAEGYITLFTSDTTKAAVGLRHGSVETTGPLEQQAELAFRGSYQLLHIPDFAYALRALDPDNEQQAGQMKGPGADAFFRRDDHNPGWASVYADLISPKLRWGKVGELPAYWYDRALFRFTPIPEPQF